jgi:hypothetical protein
MDEEEVGQEVQAGAGRDGLVVGVSDDKGGAAGDGAAGG